MQELDGDVAVILRDFVDFLECLVEVELPESVQTARETLLSRSRATLQQFSQASDSPEPYLDMNAGKSVLVMTQVEEVEQPPEYVGADERQAKRSSLQHYYETFQEFQGDGGKEKVVGKNPRNKSMDDVVMVYASFSAAQAKERSVKSGPLLHLKRERRMFTPFKVFWLNRWCWVSLVGSHLLLYANERESRPYLVIPLSGYKSRPAPGAVARDPRRSEAAFEIYCPGDRTFQFVAKSTEEMKDWVKAVSDHFKIEDSARKSREATFVEILELESNERMCIERVKEEKEKYQDVLNLPMSRIKDKSTGKIVMSENEKVDFKEEAPPLPARTRRLPSLPSQGRILYDTKEEPYDEEGLYHRIEDIKANREYQNCQFSCNGETKESDSIASIDSAQKTYDDVQNSLDESKEKMPVETYDDVQNVKQDKDEPISYDDVQVVTENAKTKTEKDKSAKSSKSSQKRSFLYRVCNRKESMKKDEKKSKSPTPSMSSTVSTIPASVNNNIKSELPCYDDISNLTGKDNNSVSPLGMREEDYQSPPPPRPIYSRPPTIIKCAVTDEIYDDIGSCIETNANGCKGCINVDVIKDYSKNGSFLSDLQLNIDQEYYQVPKSNNRMVDEYQEELYDDVALSETFKNRQRDSTFSCSSPEKSVWSRFGSGKRSRIFDHVIRQTAGNDSTDAPDETTIEHQNTKIISFQKFINKMENTLGKATKANGVTQN